MPRRSPILPAFPRPTCGSRSTASRIFWPNVSTRQEIMSREPLNDPRTLWQTQKTEDSVMSLQHVREAALKHTERNERNKRIFYIAFAGYIIVSLAQRQTGLG